MDQNSGRGPYTFVEKYLPPLMGEDHRFVGFVAIDCNGNEVAGPFRQSAARRLARDMNDQSTVFGLSSLWQGASS